MLDEWQREKSKLNVRAPPSLRDETSHPAFTLVIIDCYMDLVNRPSVAVRAVLPFLNGVRRKATCVDSTWDTLGIFIRGIMAGLCSTIWPNQLAKRPDG